MPGEWTVDVRDLRMFPETSILARRLVDEVVDQCVWGRADISVIQRLDQGTAPEMAEMGVQAIHFHARLSVAEDLPASRDTLLDRLKQVFASLQYPEYLTPLLRGDTALLFTFPEDGVAPGWMLLLEFAAPSHFLRITLEGLEETRLDLAAIPHLEVRRDEEYDFLPDRERTVRDLFQSIHAACHDQSTEFDEIPERQRALFANLRGAGLEHIQKMKLQWTNEDIPIILDNRDQSTQWFLNKLLFLLEHKRIVAGLASGRLLHVADRRYHAYVDSSQGGKVLNVSLNRPRRIPGMTSYVEKMARFGRWVSRATPHLEGVRVFLIHHITSEILGMVHALDRLGVANLHVLWVKYQGVVPDAFLESIGSLPGDRFQFHALRRARGVGSVEGSYRLSNQYSPVAHLEELGKALEEGERDFFEAMRLVAGHLFFREAMEARDRRAPLLLIEDGGYLAPEINRLCMEGRTLVEALGHFHARGLASLLRAGEEEMPLREWLEPVFVGSVEHTRNGYDYLAEVQEEFGGLAFPATSIAISDLKRGEEALGTSTSIVHAVETILHGAGKMLCYRNVMVLGSRGAIGTNLVREFGNRLTDGRVAGVDLVCPGPTTEAGFPEGRTLQDLPEEVLLDTDLFVGVTGQSVLTREFLEWLVLNGRKREVYFASGSTKTVEFATLIRWLNEIRAGRISTLGGRPVTLEVHDVRDPQTGIIQGTRYRLTPSSVRDQEPSAVKELLLLTGGMPVNFLFYGVPSEMFDRVLEQLVRLTCWLTRAYREGEPVQRRLLALDREILLKEVEEATGPGGTLT